MTQSIKAIYDAILAAAKRDELIVVEPAADSFDAPMLCVVSTDTLEITPLAVIYGNLPQKSEPGLVSADDDKLLHSMGITPFVPLSDMDGVIFGD
jgi:hypothetical protein